MSGQRLGTKTTDNSSLLLLVPGTERGREQVLPAGEEPRSLRWGVQEGRNLCWATAVCICTLEAAETGENNFLGFPAQLQ